MNPTQKRMLSILKRVDEEITIDGTLTPSTRNMVKGVIDDSQRCLECRQLPGQRHKMDCRTGSGVVKQLGWPRVRIKEDWQHETAWSGLVDEEFSVVGPSVRLNGIDWVPLASNDDEDEDPFFFKKAGLENANSVGLRIEQV